MIPKSFRGEINYGDRRFFDIDIIRIDCKYTPLETTSTLIFKYGSDEYRYNYTSNAARGSSTLSKKQSGVLGLGQEYKMVCGTYDKNESELDQKLIEIARQCMVEFKKHF